MDNLARPVFLLTDFGTRDHYAGQVRAVIHSLSPGSMLIDITHGVEPFAVDEGAWLLETALAVVPEDAVVLAVVDPGVGTNRAAIAVQARGRWFVGPDNGLLSPAFPDTLRERLDGAGVVPLPLPVRVHRIEDPAYRRDQVSNTFHARDIFAPAASAVARGVPLAALGPPVSAATLLPPFAGVPVPGRRAFEGYVVHVDRYGNVITTVRASQCGPSFSVTIAGRRVNACRTTFAGVPPGELLCHVDSSGYIAIACNQGNAARTLGIDRGAPVIVEAA